MPLHICPTPSCARRTAKLIYVDRAEEHLLFQSPGTCSSASSLAPLLWSGFACGQMHELFLLRSFSVRSTEMDFSGRLLSSLQKCCSNILNCSLDEGGCSEEGRQSLRCSGASSLSLTAAAGQRRSPPWG